MGIYKLIDTPTGYKSLIYKDSINSREVRLHSAYDPLRESERAVDSFKPGRSNLIIVAGLALGYHIGCLKRKFQNHFIILVERDTEVINIVNKFYPDHLKGVSIITSINDLPFVFEEIDISRIRGVTTYIHRPSYTLYKIFYDSILKNIKEYISSKVSDLLTRFEFEENWISNIFKNVYYIYTATPVSNLFGKFIDMPGIIVSAGPSLKKNAKLLSKIRDKALIVCVDTAIKVLEKFDIIPHIIMTLDSQKYSLKHFLGLANNKSILLADIVSYPRVMESYKGEIIISATSKYYSDKNGKVKRETTPIWDWIEESTGPTGDIQSGGSVATSIFDLFLNLGCSPIILIGQDLAYTGREIHCAGTYHNDEWLPKTSRFLNLETINQNVIRKRKIKYVEGYNGKERVISDFIFDIYKCWFKDSAAKVNIDVINSTEGGARIENTKEIMLKEIISTIKTPDKSPDEILKLSLTENPYNKPRKPGILINAADNAIKDLNDLQSRFQSPPGDNALSDEKIFNLINNTAISKIISPFLQKTYVYLARHPDLPEKKAADLLISDINASAKKLISMLELCKKNLEKIR